MRFKEYLKESEHQFLTDEKEIEHWLWEHDIRDYVINKNKTIHVSSGVNLEYYDLEFLPIQFDMIEGGFRIGFNKLRSLKGCPRKVIDDFDCMNNPNLTSYEFAPEIIGNTFYAGHDNVTSLEGLDFDNLEWRHLKIDFAKVKSHCIGLLHIKTLQTVSDSETRILNSEKDTELSRSLYAWNIIRRYIGRPEDFFECQAELLDNGFDEYAKL